MTKVVGVRFRNVGKIYYFSPKDYEIKTGDHVIVETARGIEYGKVVLAPREVGEEDVVHPLKEVLRVPAGQLPSRFPPGITVKTTCRRKAGGRPSRSSSFFMRGERPGFARPSGHQTRPMKRKSVCRTLSEQINACSTHAPACPQQRISRAS